MSVKIPPRRGRAPLRTPKVSYEGVNRRRSPAATCPTPWWVDQVRAGRGVFPPPAEHTPMIQCQSGHTRCEKHYPFYYGQFGELDCEDCRQAYRVLPMEQELRREGLLASQKADDIRDRRETTLADEEPRPVSPYVDAIMKMADGDTRLVGIKLAEEDTARLEGEIRRYLKTGQVWITFDDGTEAVVVRDSEGRYEEQPIEASGEAPVAT